MTSQKFEFIDHPADIKLRAHGKDLGELFSNAALGMMQFIFGNQQILADTSEEIEITSNNVESLLVDWLAEILALSAINHRAYTNFIIKKISEQKIFAILSSGTAIAEDEIKAVTYHELNVYKTSSGWDAEVVFDI